MRVNVKRTMALLLALVMLVGATACGGKDKAEAKPTEPTTEAAEPAETPEEEPAEDDIPEGKRIVTDSNGEEVLIDENIERVAPAIGAFSQMTASLTGENSKIVAAATQNISDYFKHVFPGYEKTNPEGYDTSSVEEVIASGAQVSYGPSSLFSDEQKAQLLEADIPYVTIDNIADVDGMCQSFEIIGSILGEDEYQKALQFVDYYRGNIDKAADITKDIPEDEKVRFMQLRHSAEAYTTTNNTDISHEYMVAAGAVNVAADHVAQGDGGLIVDPELVVEWNPQVIMTMDPDSAAAILADPAFATVDAIVNKQVYPVPKGIYLWSVRSGEGAMAPLWMGSVMYPELFKDAGVDMDAVVRDFFKDYYSYEISDDEIQHVLNGTLDTLDW